MTRILSLLAFMIGAAAVLWVGSTFVTNNILALVVTTMIAIVYCIGFVELIRFQQATQSLSRSLNNIKEPVSNLSNWLNQLHPSLQNATRLRIEGERTGLPTPILTPYLVGLLVMLGLLGTFIGMVDTLKGAVLAMQGSSELEAIRAGLTAPIKGLGLAFGTSVAGVAASAILGLISTLSRRERVFCARLLDQKVHSYFSEYSLHHNRQQTFSALQGLAGQFERMTENMTQRLLSNQNSFHDSVAKAYVELAQSVDSSLKESLANSGQIVGETIKPILTETMSNISHSLQTSNDDWLKLQQKNEEQRLDKLAAAIENNQQQASSQMSNSAKIFSDEIHSLITKQEQAFEKNSDNIQALTQHLSQQWQQSTANQQQQQQHISQDFTDKITQLANAQETAFTHISDNVSQMLATLQLHMDKHQEKAQFSQQSLTENLSQELQQMSNTQQQSLQIMNENFSQVATAISEQWQQAGEQSKEQQQAMTQSLSQAAQSIASHAQTGSEEILNKMSTLLEASEALMQERTRSESDWLESHNLRMQDISNTLSQELTSLRDAEAERGNAAIERLAELETAVAKQLENLGSALEAPMTRLIETASETPKAAAEVIAQMRGEISKNIEKDNMMLEERQRIMSDLNTVSDTLHQTSLTQRDAAQQLVSSSAEALEKVGTQFSEHLQTQLGNINTSVDHFSSSAVEMHSMGEAFSVAIALFNDSNKQLIDKLDTIEKTLAQSSKRSDEQMGYYVAQARELIDHSVLSQKEIFEELRQIGNQNELFEVAAD